MDHIFGHLVKYSITVKKNHLDPRLEQMTVLSIENFTLQSDNILRVLTLLFPQSIIFAPPAKSTYASHTPESTSQIQLSLLLSTISTTRTTDPYLLVPNLQ